MQIHERSWCQNQNRSRAQLGGVLVECSAFSPQPCIFYSACPLSLILQVVNSILSPGTLAVNNPAKAVPIDMNISTHFEDKIMALVVKDAVFDLVLHDLVCLDQNESSGDEIRLTVSPHTLQQVTQSVGNGIESSSYAIKPQPRTAYKSGSNEVHTGDSINLNQSVEFIGRVDFGLAETDFISFGFVSIPYPSFLGSSSIEGKDYVNKGLSSLDFISQGTHYQLTFEVKQSL